ncbi:MAG TPA: TolC family protein [Polyangia bacterium]|jgi:Outer membrane protein|nr:TolC family protein [Polyangia bacterium]
MKRLLAFPVVLCLVASPASGQQGRVLTLDQALRAARANHPQLQVAHAQSEVADARAYESRASLLPQVIGAGSYQRTTNNYPSGGSSVGPSTVVGTGTSTNTSTSIGTIGSNHGSFDTSNYFRFGVTASQLIYDFGQTTGKWNAAKTNARSQLDSETRSLQQISFNLRAAYYSAAATYALVKVAQDGLTNQEAHLVQAQGFVRAGTQPEIALAQALTNRATARVQLITAQNGHDVAKAQLNQAMGVEGPIDYEVEVPPIEPVADEDRSTDELLALALKARPDLQALADQIRAQEFTIGATKGGYYPALSASTALTDAGPAVDNLAWNWYGMLSLSWPIFGGGITDQQVREARATISVLRGQYEIQRQQIRLDLEQARLAVRATKASEEATHEAAVNAREQLRLAEGRYQAGVGNMIELGDSQVAMTTASAQEVQAHFNLATARAQLLLALGQP